MIEGGNGRSRGAHSWRQVRVTSFMRARFAAFIHTTNKKGGTGQSRECKFSEAQGRRRSGSRVKVCVGTPVPIPSQGDSPRGRISSPTWADRETFVFISCPS